MALYFTGTALSQTTVVVARVPNFILIAADSKATFADGRTTSLCKIRRAGRAFFSFTGMLEHLSVWNAIDSVTAASLPCSGGMSRGGCLGSNERVVTFAGVRVTLTSAGAVVVAGAAPSNVQSINAISEYRTHARIMSRC